MEVMYWQLLVAISTTGAYIFLSRTSGMFVAGLWTLWTLFKLHYEPLIVLQIAIAWGSFVVVDKIKNTQKELTKTKDRLAELENALKDYSQNVRNAAKVAENNNKTEKIEGTDHHRYLFYTIKQARESVLIFSGWISSNVVDFEFCRIVENALQRGVNVYIGFGYEDPSGHHSMTPKSEEALNSLSNLINQTKDLSGSLKIGKINTHEKFLIRDSEEIVCGSANWLSNRIYKNRETSFIVKDETLAKSEFSEFKSLIEKNLIRGRD